MGGTQEGQYLNMIEQHLAEIMVTLHEVRDYLNESNRYLRGIYDHTPAD